jgi:hypothetical protein
MWIVRVGTKQLPVENNAAIEVGDRTAGCRRPSPDTSSRALFVFPDLGASDCVEEGVIDRDALSRLRRTVPADDVSGVS